MGVPLDLDEDALCVIADVTRQAELGRQSVGVRPEPHPLDHAGDPQPHAADGRDGHGHTGHAVGPLRRPSVTAASRCMRPKL